MRATGDGIVSEFCFCETKLDLGKPGIFGFLTVKAPEGFPVTSISLDFWVDPQETGLKRSLERLEAGESHVIGFSLKASKEKTVREQTVWAKLTWSEKGAARSTQVAASFQCPLEVPCSGQMEPPEITKAIKSWEERLRVAAAELAREEEASYDFWSLPIGKNTEDPGYALGFELYFADDKPRANTKGVAIEMRRRKRRWILSQAGTSWSGKILVPFPRDFEENIDLNSENLRKVDDTLEVWLDRLRRALEKRTPTRGRSRNSGPVENSEPKPTGTVPEEDLQFWRAAVAQIYPTLTGQPIFLLGFSLTDITDSEGEILDPKRIEALPVLTSELLRAHRVKNSRSSWVPEGFQFSKRETLQGVWPSKPRDFFRIYPESPGSLALSRPAYSVDGKSAVLKCTRFDLGTVKHELCFWEKEGDRWKLMGRVDDGGLVAQLTTADLQEIQRLDTLREMEELGVEVRGLSMVDAMVGRAELRLPCGRTIIVISDFGLCSYFEETDLGYFSEDVPVLVLSMFDQTQIGEALGRDWPGETDLEGLDDKPRVIKGAARARCAPLESLIYLGSRGERGDKRRYYRARLHSGETLLFTMVDFLRVHAQPIPIERLVVLKDFGDETVLEAVKEYVQKKNFEERSKVYPQT